MGGHPLPHGTWNSMMTLSWLRCRGRQTDSPWTLTCLLCFRVHVGRRRPWSETQKALSGETKTDTKIILVYIRGSYFLCLKRRARLIWQSGVVVLDARLCSMSTFTGTGFKT